MVLVDSLSDRHIVRIFDNDKQHVITTILAIPNYRLQPTGKTVFQYWEVPAGQPKALRAWFYPGDNFGQEFAYQTSELAETKPEPVLQAEPVQTAAALAPTSVEPEQTLPETASAMPLLGLIGMLSLAAFAALRIRSRRIL